MPPSASLRVSVTCFARREYNVIDKLADKRKTWLEFLEDNGVDLKPEEFRLSYSSNNRPVIEFDQTIEEFLKQFKRRKSSLTVKLVQLRIGGNVQRGRPPLNGMAASPSKHRVPAQHGPVHTAGVKRPQPVRMVQHNRNHVKAPRLENGNFARSRQREEEEDEEDSDDDDDEGSSVQIPYGDRVKHIAPRPPIPLMRPPQPPPSPQRPNGKMPHNFARPIGMPPPRAPYQHQQPPRIGPLGSRAGMGAHGHNYRDDDNESLFSAATQDSQDNVEGGGEIQAVVVNKLIRGVPSSELVLIKEEIQGLMGTDRGMKIARYAPRCMNMLTNVFAS